MAENRSMDDQFLNLINKLIEENIGSENFSVEDLAKKAGLSRSMLHRKLIKITGKSARDLITKARLLKAKELLEKDVATASEIAYCVGFKSPSYFNKVFKKHFQISPGEIRKGKKVVPGQLNNRGNLYAGKFKSPVLIFLIILCAIVLAISGVYFFNGKTDLAETSIAILPFDNLSSNDDTQYFADGIVEDLLTRLSPIKNLKVISRTSSEMFRNKGNKTTPEIAKILGVGYILEGTAQRESDDIRISIQLIDAKRDDHVLSKQYDRKLNDFFEVQSEIANEIAAELSLVLTDQQLNKLKHNFTENPKALELYQLGRFHSNKRTTEGYNKGIGYYEKAIAEDPAYGLAYAGLADNYHLMALQGHIDKTVGKNKAIKLAEKSLELDSDLAEPYTVLGSIFTYIDWNWEAAEKEFKKALELNPNYSTAHQYYAEYLTIIGRNDEARKHINKALKLDPFSFVIRYFSSRFYYDQEQFDEALAEIKVCLDLNYEHPWAMSLEFDIYLALEDDLAALDCSRRYGVFSNLWTPEEVDSVYQKGGFDGVTIWYMSFNGDQEYNNAIFYAMLGDDEKTMELLELAMEAGKLSPSSTTKHEYKSLRSNPRFIAIRKKMGLPPL